MLRFINSASISPNSRRAAVEYPLASEAISLGTVVIRFMRSTLAQQKAKTPESLPLCAFTSARNMQYWLRV